MQRQMEKKRKKKEAQRLKKLAARGELPPKGEENSQNLPENAISNNSHESKALEELRAKHMRELQELQLSHQRQLEEEAKRLKVSNVIQPNNNLNVEKPINRNEALSAKPGTQIKITRTPTGGVEFTTVPAANSANFGAPAASFGAPTANPMGMMGNGFPPHMAPSNSSRVPEQV